MGGYGAAYRRAFWRQRVLRGAKSGAEAAVGGAFEAIGAAQRDLLITEGLNPTSRLIDLGCGAGRLACALRDLSGLAYLGLDVVPELLGEAKTRAARPDWRFELINSPRIPAANASADMICMFSVITHISDAESQAYVTDCARVLIPGGVLVFSFLDPAIADHRRFLRSKLIEAVVTRLFWAPNVATAPEAITRWADVAGLTVRRVQSPSPLGQSVAVLQKAPG